MFHVKQTLFRLYVPLFHVKQRDVFPGMCFT